MKRIIAWGLSLCLALVAVTAGWDASGQNAAAETVAQESVTPETTQSAATGETLAQASVGASTVDTGAAGQETTVAETASPTDEAAADAQTAAPATETPTTEATSAESTPEQPADTTSQADSGDNAENVEGDQLTEVVQPVAEANVGSGPAWIPEGGHRRYGELEELLPIAMVTNLTVVLCTTEVTELRQYSVEELRGVSFGMDTDALGEYCDGRTVIISAIGPGERAKIGVVYVWIGLRSELVSPADALADTLNLPADGAQTDTEIMVQANGYAADAPCAPSFTLNALPALATGMRYAVIVNGGEPQALASDCFTPDASGEYRFAVLDEAGTVAARSQAYSVTFAQPENDTQLTESVPSGTEGDASPETGADGATVTNATETTDNAEATDGLEAADGAEAVDGTETADGTEAEGGEEISPLLTQADLVQAVTLASTAEEPEALELTVRTYDYTGETASQVTPTFELSGAPAGSECFYGVSINGEDARRLSGDRYCPTDSGDYTLQFTLYNALSEIADVSQTYRVVLDYGQAEQTGEAWMMLNQHKMYGTLGSLLREAPDGSTIYLLSDAVFRLSSSSALENVTLLPDPDRYGAEYGVIVSDTSPDGESAEGVTYLWLGVDVNAMASALSLDLAAPTFTVDGVTVGNRTLAGGMWVNGTDAFAFSVTDTEPDNAYTYEISTDGGVTFEAFAPGASLGGVSVPLINGNSYSLVFRVTAVDDASNTFVTEPCTVSYDNESPEILCKPGANFTLSIYAGDTVSGFDTSGDTYDVTFNATAAPIVWVARLTAQGQGVYTFAAQYGGAGVIAAGTVAVRDRANNVAVWGSDVIISQGQSPTGGGKTGSGARGGGGAATRTVYHSASEYTTVTAYNGVELAVETGEMSSLIVGDQPLALTLNSQGDEAQPSTFRAGFVDWRNVTAEETAESEQSDADSADTDSADTLVLTASDGSLADGACLWTFDGSVSKKLSASGIDYLVFSVGNRVAVFATAGFTGGVRYNLYRASGLASKAFVYAVRMDAAGELQIEVTVQGETFAMTSDPTSDFYYYDVFSGTLDMLSKPIGDAQACSNAGTTRLG